MNKTDMGKASLHTAFETIQQQNFEQYGRGDMFIPANRVPVPIGTAMLATPYIGPMVGHSVPVMYTHLTADARIVGPIGLSTPTVKIDPLQSTGAQVAAVTK